MHQCIRTALFIIEYTFRFSPFKYRCCHVFALAHTGKCIRRFGGIYAYGRYLKDGSGTYWCKYYVEKHAICLKDYRIRSFLSFRYVHVDLCKHLGIDSSTGSVLESIPKCLHKSPSACRILKNDLIL